MDAYVGSKTPKEERDRRGTPWWLVAALLHELNRREFTIDICAEPDTAKAKRFVTKEQDSLRNSWRKFGVRAGSLVFMNPPYSDPAPWLLKARTEAIAIGCTVVGVVPDQRAAKWFRNHIEGRAIVGYLPWARVSFYTAAGVKQPGNPSATVCPVWASFQPGTTGYARLSASNKDWERHAEKGGQ